MWEYAEINGCIPRMVTFWSQLNWRGIDHSIAEPAHAEILVARHSV